MLLPRHAVSGNTEGRKEEKNQYKEKKKKTGEEEKKRLFSSIPTVAKRQKSQKKGGEDPFFPRKGKKISTSFVISESEEGLEKEKGGAYPSVSNLKNWG